MRRSCSSWVCRWLKLGARQVGEVRSEEMIESLVVEEGSHSSSLEPLFMWKEMRFFGDIASEVVVIVSSVDESVSGGGELVRRVVDFMVIPGGISECLVGVPARTLRLKS